MAKNGMIGRYEAGPYKDESKLEKGCSRYRRMEENFVIKDLYKVVEKSMNARMVLNR